MADQKYAVKVQFDDNEIKGHSKERRKIDFYIHQKYRPQRNHEGHVNKTAVDVANILRTRSMRAYEWMRTQTWSLSQPCEVVEYKDREWGIEAIMKEIIEFSSNFPTENKFKLLLLYSQIENHLCEFVINPRHSDLMQCSIKLRLCGEYLKGNFRLKALHFAELCCDMDIAVNTVTFEDVEHGYPTDGIYPSWKPSEDEISRVIQHCFRFKVNGVETDDILNRHNKN
jgi:hypothetical protein